MSAQPWLTVVMPVYNGTAYLARTLDSVVAQADRAVEVIAVDDGSSDDTVALLRSYCDRLRLTVLTTETRSGNRWAANVNRALELAQAPHACILHHDDTWVPGRLASIRQSIRDFPDASLHLHPAWFIDESGRRLGVWRCPLPPRRPLAPADTIRCLLVQNFIAAPAPVVRVEMTGAPLRLDPALVYAADWDLWLKAAGRGSTVYNPVPLVEYRVHAGSDTAANPTRVASIGRELTLVLERHLAGVPTVGGDEAWRAACRFSVRVNLALFAVAGHQSVAWRSLATEYARLGRTGRKAYTRNARLTSRFTTVERVDGPSVESGVPAEDRPWRRTSLLT